MKSFGADMTISDFSIDTDYYFWSRKGNRFMYRAEEAVPVGFNTFPFKYTYCRDLFDYLQDSNETEVLEDLRIRMDKANEAGARVLRMVMVAGWADMGNWAPVDVPFAVHNSIKVAKEVAGAPDDTKSGTITYEAFADFMREVVTMARERDLVILPALRYGPTKVCYEILNGNQYHWNETGDGPANYLYVGNDGDVNTFEPSPNNLVSCIKDIIQHFTDETAIFGWQYFNEAAGIRWIWNDENNDGDIDPEPNNPDWGERRPFRAGSFFTECTKFLTDEKVLITTPIPGAMSDKHIFSSGMWHFDYAGELYTPSESVRREQISYVPTLHNLLHDTTFCRYDDFIDWHRYGFDAQRCDSAVGMSIQGELNDYYINAGYNSDTCPPMIFGEINPWNMKDYSKDKDIKKYRFAGYERILYVPNNNNRNWEWKLIDDSISWDYVHIPPIQVQTFDANPSYLRQNQHYKLWKDWYDGITNITDQDNKKIGYFLWHLVNTNQTFPLNEEGIYDPAKREEEEEPNIGKINYYDLPEENLMNWHNIYFNDFYYGNNFYSFYLNLSKKDWGIK